MDSNSPSPKQEDNEPKAEFRKLTNEAANRKYRRRSPVTGSSDEEGGRKHGHDLRGNSKVSDQDRRNDDRLDEKISSRSQRGDNADSYRQSSRSYRSRHDDYPKHGKYADDEDRIHAKSSSRSGRDSRSGAHSDRRDLEGDYNRSRDHYKDVDRYSRDRSDADRKYKDKDLSSDRIGYDARHGSRYDDYDRHAGDRDHRDEKRDYRSSRGHRNDRTASYEDSRGHHNDSTPKREMADVKDLDGSKYRQPGKNKNDGSDRHEARPGGGGGKFEDMSTFVGEDIAAKKPKLFSVEENDARKDQKPTLGSKQGQELVPKDTSEEAPVTGCHSAANLDAAKVAAIKAAELVNQNLVGTGFMTADQKKKLLWGSKKNSNTEESSRRWGTALFSDREQQEKFNKLMSLRLPWCIWPIVGRKGGCEGRSETSKQSRCGEAEGTSAGSGEAVHRRAPEKRWSHCGIRAVGFFFGCPSEGTLPSCLVWLFCMRILFLVAICTVQLIGSSRVLVAVEHRFFLVMDFYMCEFCVCVSSVCAALAPCICTLCPFRPRSHVFQPIKLWCSLETE